MPARRCAIDAIAKSGGFGSRAQHHKQNAVPPCRCRCIKEWLSRLIFRTKSFGRVTTSGVKSVVEPAESPNVSFLLFNHPIWFNHWKFEGKGVG